MDKEIVQYLKQQQILLREINSELKKKNSKLESSKTNTRQRKAIVATCLVGSLFVHAVFLLSDLPSLSYLTLADKMIISIFSVFVGAGVAILLRQHHLNRKEIAHDELRINEIPLSQKHEIIFRDECNILSQKIHQSLCRLMDNPRDKEEIKNLVQLADTAMGNSRFLNDTELEKSARLIVESFKGITDVRKNDEYYDLLDQFESISKKVTILLKPSVIVIDDDPDIREVHSEFLRLNSIEVLATGNNGKDAVELYQKYRPDVVLMNLNMPDFDGFYGLKNIRDIDYNAKVVINTGSAEHDAKNRLIEMGAFAIIEKPHGITDLVEILDKLSLGDSIQEPLQVPYE